VARPTWVLRAGEDNRHADAFVDGGYAAVAFPELGDGRPLDRYQVTRALERAEVPDPPAAAARFHMFVHTMAPGDAVVLLDAHRKELVFGVVAGDYEYVDSAPPSQFRHRRAVRWVGRHDRETLPAQWHGFHKQRPVIARYDAATLDEHIDRVLAGGIGRPARQRSAVRVSSGSGAGARPRTSSPRVRAAPKPKAPVKRLRTCPGCGFNLNETVFEGQELCRDCR
jgi:hypothetical protein